MSYVLLAFFSALFLEILGSYISIVGLSAKASIIIVLIVVALDVAKIVIVTALYKNWKHMAGVLKAGLLPVLIVLMGITCFGGFGYLSKEFSSTMLTQNKNQSQLTLLQDDLDKLENRKVEIDKQISQLPADQVNQRRRLNEMFAPELKDLNEKISSIKTQLPELKLQNLENDANNGIVGTASKVMNLEPEKIVLILSGFMTLLIDPLAIMLIILSNFLLERYRLNQKLKENELEQKEKDKKEQERLDNEEKIKLLKVKKEIQELENKNEELDITKLEVEKQAKLEADFQAKLEAERKAELEAKRQAELEVKRQAELEAKRQAELEAKRQAELEAKRKAELENNKKATDMVFKAIDEQHVEKDTNVKAGSEEDTTKNFQLFVTNLNKKTIVEPKAFTPKNLDKVAKTKPSVTLNGTPEVNDDDLDNLDSFISNQLLEENTNNKE